MTREERIREAGRMRFEEGLTLKEIAAHFDVGPKTVWGWTQEARHGAEWRARENARKRAWEKENPKRSGCRTCGLEPLHCATYVRECVQCRGRKYRYIERRWNEGAPVMYIAADVGMGYMSLQALISKLRKRPEFHLPPRKELSEEGRRNLENAWRQRGR